MSKRDEQVSQTIAHLAADFFARSSETGSLITVTHAELTPNFKEATVFITVLPVSSEATALKSAKRLRTDFREYIKKHTFLHPIPFVDFEIDYGEKNRQRVDELTR